VEPIETGEQGAEGRQKRSSRPLGFLRESSTRDCQADAFLDERKDVWDVEPICRRLPIAPSPCHAGRKRPPPTSDPRRINHVAREVGEPPEDRRTPAPGQWHQYSAIRRCQRVVCRPSECPINRDSRGPPILESLFGHGPNRGHLLRSCCHSRAALWRSTLDR
jgi:hypothetical protein